MLVAKNGSVSEDYVEEVAANTLRVEKYLLRLMLDTAMGALLFGHVI